MIVVQQILKAWELHNDAMLLTLVNIPREAYDLSVPTEGGGNIKDQIFKIYKTRLENIQSISKNVSLTPIKIISDFETELLKTSFVKSGILLKEAVDKSLKKKENKVEVHVTNLVNSISSLIRNEARQRRNILAEIKKAGMKLNNKLQLEI